jgi:TonB family protein
MYEDLARSQRPSALEWLVVNMVLPSLLVTFALQWRGERPAELRRPESEGLIVSILPVMGLDDAYARFGPIPDLFPKLLSMARLEYPPFLHGSVSHPRVFLRALVEPNGSVSPSSIVIVQSPDPQLNEPARRALMAAVFQPASLAGHRVGAWITIAVNFNPRPE